MKDLKDSGYPSKDVADEIGKSQQLVNAAWSYRTYASYRGTDRFSRAGEEDDEDSNEEVEEIDPLSF